MYPRYASDRPWGGILPTHLRKSAIQSVTEIATALSGTHVHRSGYDQWSAALLFAYLALKHPAQAWQDRAVRTLNGAIDRLSSESSGPALYGGVAGVGWAVQHVRTLLGNEVAAPEGVLRDVDALLCRQLERQAWRSHYDLIAGVVGVGVYFLERLPRTSARRGLKLALRQLAESRVSFPGRGIAWFSPPESLVPHQRVACPDGHYNLGVAHGLPGVIAFLAQCVSRRVHADLARPLLIGAVSWLRSVESPQAQGKSHFGPWIPVGREPSESGIAWCYGDLGIAGVLHGASVALRDLDLQKWSEGILDNCASRSSEHRTTDAALCHGAVGVAHIFNRVFQRTRVQRFRQAAVQWFERAMQWRKVGSGVAGYFAWKPELPNPEDPDPSFLSGAAGIGLALLSALNSNSPGWDRLLLLSGLPNGSPPRES